MSTPEEEAVKPDKASSLSRLKPNQRLVIGAILGLVVCGGVAVGVYQAVKPIIIEPIKITQPSDIPSPTVDISAHMDAATADAMRAAADKLDPPPMSVREMYDEEVESPQGGMTDEEIIAAGGEFDYSHELEDTNECMLLVPVANTEAERMAMSKSCNVLVWPSRDTWCIMQTFNDDCIYVARTDL